MAGGRVAVAALRAGAVTRQRRDHAATSAATARPAALGFDRRAFPIAAAFSVASTVNLFAFLNIVGVVTTITGLAAATSGSGRAATLFGVGGGLLVGPILYLAVAVVVNVAGRPPPVQTTRESDVRSVAANPTEGCPPMRRRRPQSPTANPPPADQPASAPPVYNWGQFGRHRLRAPDGAIIDVPVPTGEARQVWVATMWPDPNVAGGWARALWQPHPATGRGWRIPLQLAAGDVVEFGADTPHQPMRWYGIMDSYDVDRWATVQGPYPHPGAAHDEAQRLLALERYVPPLDTEPARTTEPCRRTHRDRPQHRHRRP